MDYKLRVGQHFSGRLACDLPPNQNEQPSIVPGDIYRPAASDRPHSGGRKHSEGIDFSVKRETSKQALTATNQAWHHAQHGGNDVIIEDTGGLAIDEELMAADVEVMNEAEPSEILFVVDSMTGQDAVNTARTFNERLNFDGVVLTKLDGDTRGGAALSIKSEVNKPIKFIGTGEKMDALDVFHPERMASRILGMGDVVSLVERAQEQYDEEEAKRLEKRIRKDQFDFNDFLDQIGQIKKMGSMKDLMGMIPGVGKAMKDVEVNEDAFKHIEAIIQSMTPAERKSPSLLNGSRKQRIAKGSGRNIDEVNRLMKQFDQTKQMMKMMTNKTQMMQMMKQMKGARGGIR